MQMKLIIISQQTQNNSMFWNCTLSYRLARFLCKVDEKDLLLENQKVNTHTSSHWHKKSLKNITERKLHRTSNQPRNSLKNIHEINTIEMNESKNPNRSMCHSLPCQYLQNFQTTHQLQESQFQQKDKNLIKINYSATSKIHNQQKISLHFTHYSGHPSQVTSLSISSCKQMTTPEFRKQKLKQIQNIRFTDSIIIEQKHDLRKTHVQETSENKFNRQLPEQKWQNARSTVSINSESSIADSIVLERILSISRVAELL